LPSAEEYLTSLRRDAERMLHEVAQVPSRILSDIVLAGNRNMERSAIRGGPMAVRCFSRLILLDAVSVIGYSPVAELLSVETIKGVFLVQARFP
jgi:hypothetical protein